MNQTIPKFCPNCESEIRFIQAGISKRTGKRYGEFYGCSNRDCNFTLRVEKENYTAIGGQINPQEVSAPPSVAMEKPKTGEQIIIDELEKINKRIKDLVVYLKKKFGE